MTANKLHPEYSAWSNMRTRCLAPKNPAFHNYGGRGIKVCERWALFQNFLADMGQRPSRAHTLERNNNDGDYGPDNCRWATRIEQGRNKRNNKLLTVNGKTATLVEWSETTGIPSRTIYCRIRDGREPSECISTEGVVRRKPRVTCRGERKGSARLTEPMVMEVRRLHSSGHSIYALAKKMGIGRTSMLKAIKGITWSHVPMYAIKDASLCA